MSQILSQQEIDTLLASLPVEQEEWGAQPERAHKIVKPYDFMRPDKFSKDQIRALEMVHENFARRLSSVLSAYLRTVLQLSLASIEQQIYEEFIEQLPQPVVLAVLSMDPLPGRALLELDSSTGFAIIDRLLGGLGKPPDTPRQMTDIETSLIDGVLGLALQTLAEVWAGIARFTPAVEDITFTPQFLQLAMGTDVVLTIRWEVRMGDFNGGLAICIPYAVLESVVARLSAQVMFTGQQRSVPPRVREALRGQVDRVRVPVVAIMGRTQVMVREMLHLQVGDVITLHAPARRPLEVTTGGLPKFRGRPGTVGRGLAIEIVEVLPQEPLFEPEPEGEAEAEAEAEAEVEEATAR